MSSQAETGKKRKRVSSSEPSSSKTRRIITPTESKLILNCVQFFEGNLNAVMEEPRVKALGLTLPHVQNHLTYIRRRRKNSSLNAPENGKEERERIVSYLEDEPTTSLDQTNDTPQSPVQPSFSPTLTPAEQVLHELDKRTFSSAVASSSIQSAEEFVETGTQLSDKQKIRNSRIQAKAAEKRSVASEIRLRREQSNENQTIQSSVMLMLLRQQQMMMSFMMKMFEPMAKGNDPTPKNFQDKDPPPSSL